MAAAADVQAGLTPRGPVGSGAAGGGEEVADIASAEAILAQHFGGGGRGGGGGDSHTAAAGQPGSIAEADAILARMGLN